ncbi:MAG: hypothetical protein GEU73_02755 [Chloroflexi bacterium]|nr:hypothetical protein [Chloroflexota bacterium]
MPHATLPEHKGQLVSGANETHEWAWNVIDLVDRSWWEETGHGRKRQVHALVDRALAHDPALHLQLSDAVVTRETNMLRYAALVGYCLGRTAPTGAEGQEAWLAQALTMAGAGGLRELLLEEE